MYEQYKNRKNRDEAAQGYRARGLKVKCSAHRDVICWPATVEDEAITQVEQIKHYGTLWTVETG